MPRPLSNIASLNIFDSAFHFITSRAARGAETFHFQFDSAIERSICEGKYQGKYRVAVPCPWTPERLDWVEVVFDLKNELAPPEISVYSEEKMTSSHTYFYIERLHKASIIGNYTVLFIRIT